MVKLLATVDPAIITTIVVASIGGVGAIIVALINKKASRENLFIDQLQERMATLNKRADDADTRADNSERKFRVLSDYVGQLRNHIDEKKNPPPPPYPPGL